MKTLQVGDSVWVKGVVAENIGEQMPTNWPIRIELDQGQSQTVDLRGRVHFSAIAAGPCTLAGRALTFATAAHAAVGHVRKYTGEAYIHHPIAVAEIVKSVPHDDGMIAAALLHDVVEDTRVDREMIYEVFGADVAHLVDWLTDRDRSGNRAARKAADRERLSRAPGRAQTIKVADLIHNTESIVAHDPDFARIYMREKADLLPVLVRADETLLQRAREQVRSFTIDREETNIR